MIQNLTIPDLIERADQLTCENPADAKHRTDLITDYLKSGILTHSQVVWLLNLVNRHGARYRPPLEK